MLQTLLDQALTWFALPKNGLVTVFVVALVSATLLPLGSEPAVFAYVSMRPDLFWLAMVVATAGNTLGGVINYWMGRGAKHVMAPDRQTHYLKWFAWARVRCCFPSCPRWVIRCVPWPAGCACRWLLPSCGWHWASSCATCS